MKSQNSVFIIFCLSITVVLVFAYSQFVKHFDGSQKYKMQIGSLRQQIEKEKFNNDLMVYQLKDFQQSVAQLIPRGDVLVANQNLQNFSSVLRSPASLQPIDLSGVLFERAKRHFNEKDYDMAIKEFRKIPELYPTSPHNVTSHFFVAESYFLKKDYKTSLSYIDEMVRLYPDNNLTGYILLRMGQISEMNNQYEEASEIYKIVEKNFADSKLKLQAKKLEKGVEF